MAKFKHNPPESLLYHGYTIRIQQGEEFAQDEGLYHYVVYDPQDFQVREDSHYPGRAECERCAIADVDTYILFHRAGGDDDWQLGD